MGEGQRWDSEQTDLAGSVASQRSPVRRAVRSWAAMGPTAGVPTALKPTVIKISSKAMLAAPVRAQG